MKIHKDFLYLATIIILLGLCGQFYYDFHYRPRHDISVYYNKDIQANEKINAVIRDADEFVYFAIYTFTKPDIKDALLGAKHRGVDVRGVVDGEQSERIEEQKKIIDELKAAGIPIAFDNHSAIMHLKTIVTEKEYVTGSYNWTKSATDSNDEVIEIGSDDNVRRGYQRVLEKLFDLYFKENP